MIGRLRGVIASKAGERVLIDVAGVGYEVMVTPQALVDLPAVGEEGVLHTHLHVREDQMALFGFIAEDQRDLLRILLSVSALDPRWRGRFWGPFRTTGCAAPSSPGMPPP